MQNNTDALLERFERTAPLLAEREERGRLRLREKLERFLELRGDERVLDAGAGTGALALAIAPLVREVIALDIVPALLDEGRSRASEAPNVAFVAGDMTRLEFAEGAFDLVGTFRTLHHVARPEQAIAELSRVTRLGGRVLVIDKIAPADPLAAVSLDHFERARDPSHTRTLPDIDVRALLEANGLVLRASRFEQEPRELDEYLDWAGCEGQQRERALGLAPVDYVPTIGWYLAVRPAPRA
jgi:ubiquinone/menaquinone biosynthesis C-methylase UbiE